MFVGVEIHEPTHLVGSALFRKHHFDIVPILPLLEKETELETYVGKVISLETYVFVLQDGNVQSHRLAACEVWTV